ncbi:poly(A)-specific ribonuclease [Fonsecaea erecta]|uniref:Poly(A)-specific ribonuclease n=1 Tax=Fonsecaea erecta TaxID=1367422 RepID=A0A178ZWL4_9EURO|nr:poly(A)-specific ribonuclease [Fonsecaea erecta]OAP64087.1 poly(A)-specific ribonuclease [Fonsecaea erecta]
MDINSGNFSEEVIKIIQHIATSRFIALDLEFSGVAGRRGGSSGKLDLHDYYQDLRSAAQMYQILQVGLTVVTEDIEEGRYEVRPYNFYLNPLPTTKESVFARVWSYNSGAISFLLRNGFNIDKPFLQGIHYLSRQEEDQVRKKLIEDEQMRSNMPDMKLKEEDTFLVEHVRQSIDEWQTLAKGKQQSYLNIPKEDAEDPIPSVLNRYQVRLTHQIVRNEYPNLKTQGMGHFVQVTNPTSKQQANEKREREEKREADIANAIGFRWILEAIIGGDISKLPHLYVVAGFPPEDQPKDVQAFLNELQNKLRSQSRALVGHNCLTDVMNLYRCFVGDLPETIQDFSARLRELFPVIIDTKYVAGLGNKRWADTSLRAVERDLDSVTLPEVHLPLHFDQYVYAASYHEAGYDSFVTAKIGLRLPTKLRREQKDVESVGKGPALIMEEETSALSPKDAAQTTTEAHARQDGQKQGMTQSLADMIKAPVSTVKSMLTGVPSTVDQVSTVHAAGGSSHMEADEKRGSGRVVATRDRVKPHPVSNDELKKLRVISKKANIFDMLEDDPTEASEEQLQTNEQQRIASLVEEGRLLPRWEEDAEFWQLLSNKLQANATQQGILDLTKH